MTRSLSSSRLSRSARRDPSHTRTLRNTYERKLVRIMRGYKERAVNALMTATRQLAEPVPLDFGTLANALEAAGKQAAADATPIVDETMQVANKAGGEYAATVLKAGGLALDINLAGPVDPQVIKNLVARNLSGLKGITDETSKQIVRELTEGTRTGEGIVKLSARVRERCDNIGIHRSRLLARTETMQAFNDAIETRFAQHGVTEWEWLAGGPNMCDDCAALNGNRYPIGGGPPMPLHPNCVCTRLPVIKEISP